MTNLGQNRAFFIHNWRCAGSTLNSILSSNFGDKYYKIGTQFSDTGWPLYGKPERLLLRDARIGVANGCIFGGHLCSGVEALIPGDWHLWLNAREPIDRLTSGIIRFHASKFLIKPGAYSIADAKAHSLSIFRELFSGPLRHECNGISKRLAGLSSATAFNVDLNTNLETLSCFDSHSSDELLYEAALLRLDSAKIIILPGYLHESLMCIERMYSLPPLLNLFSDLRHNSSDLGKASSDQMKLFELGSEFISSICGVDLLLWPKITKKFHEQLGFYSISERDILIRKIIHAEPFVSPDIIQSAGNDKEVIQKITARLVDIARRHPDLAVEIVQIVASWSRFKKEVSKEIMARSLKILGATPTE